jgi:hypothetical protein
LTRLVIGSCCVVHTRKCRLHSECASMATLKAASDTRKMIRRCRAGGARNARNDGRKRPNLDGNIG